MSMMHFEPFRSMRDLDRLSSQLLSGTRVPLAMPMDVWREGQAYHVALDLPGVDPDAIDLRVERNTLTVSAQRQPLFAAPADRPTSEQGSDRDPSDGAQTQVLVAERPMGTFTRAISGSVRSWGLRWTEPVTSRFSDRFDTNGNGCAGSIASGVTSGQMLRR